LAIEPWTAAGPGWANAGATAYYEDTYLDKIETRRETIYSHHNGEIAQWLGVALIANDHLRKEFEKREVPCQK
jgi:hypothetical protein